jgi:hypothetical protein
MGQEGGGETTVRREEAGATNVDEEGGGKDGIWEGRHREGIKEKRELPAFLLRALPPRPRLDRPNMRFKKK